jgi:hypothetical protein
MSVRAVAFVHGAYCENRRDGCAENPTPVTLNLPDVARLRRNADPMTIASHTAVCFAPDLRVHGGCMRGAISVGQRSPAHTAFIGGCATP